VDARGDPADVARLAPRLSQTAWPFSAINLENSPQSSQYAVLLLFAGIQSIDPLLILTLPNARPFRRTGISTSTLPTGIGRLMLSETS
jgi:hypothetical protein